MLLIIQVRQHDIIFFILINQLEPELIVGFPLIMLRACLYPFSFINTVICCIRSVPIPWLRYSSKKAMAISNAQLFRIKRNFTLLFVVTKNKTDKVLNNKFFMITSLSQIIHGLLWSIACKMTSKSCPNFLPMAGNLPHSRNPYLI